MAAKKKAVITAVISVFLVAAVSLILWDPANLLRLRGVDGASGLYRVEESGLSEDGLLFESIFFSDNGTATVKLDDNEGEQNLILTYDVSGNITILSFSYNRQTCSLFCTRKSNSFKLIGNTSCDYLQCAVHKTFNDTETIIGNFVAVRISE